MISEEIVDRAIRAMGGRANYEYFFEHITSPEWIAPLASRGFFKAPPPEEVEDSFVKFPPWPASRYLARVAAKAPSEVMDVLRKLEEVTNPRIQEDVIEAALAMPPSIAVELVPMCIGFIESSYIRWTFGLTIAEKLGNLAVKLAKDGLRDNALGIFRSLLTFEVDEDQEGSLFTIGERVVPKIDANAFELLLSEPASALIRALGSDAQTVVEDALSTFLDLEFGDEARPEDFSYINRPAIEDHGQNWRRGPFAALVEAVRNNGLYLCKGSRDDALNYINHLFAKRWKIFHRLAMNLLETAPLIETGDVIPVILNDQFMEDIAVRHEFFRLLGKFFSTLSVNQQEQILAQIDNRDINAISQVPSRDGVSKVTTEEAESQADYERFIRLFPIKDALQGRWKQQFERLAAEFGANELVEGFAIFDSPVVVGPTSPLTAEELSEMTPTEVARYLRFWVKDSGNFFAPTPEGLGRVVTEVVTQRPSEFTKVAGHFKDLDPTYVRAFLHGVENGVKTSSTTNDLHWAEVIGLCEWVLEQPRELNGSVIRRDADPDWGWARAQIAALLFSGLRGNSAPDFTLRPRIWGVVKPLCADPDPTPDYEARYGGANMDLYTAAINSVRGQAVQSAMQYAYWVHRNATNAGEAYGSLEGMPEVVELLNAHLDVSFEPSLAVRSVFGRWTPLLIVVGRDWFAENHERIFPIDDQAEQYWQASWNAYIKYNGLFKNVFDALQPEYEVAVKKLHDISSRDLQSPEVLLAEHVLSVGITGGNEGASQLKDRLFSKDVPQIRANALYRLGLAFNRHIAGGGIVHSDIIANWQNFWHSLYERSSTGKDGDFREELRAFGSWFAAGMFEPKWSLALLRDVARVAGDARPVHLVLERLARLSGSSTSEVLQVLKALVAAPDDESRLLAWEPNITIILREGLSSSDNEVSQVANNLINLMGARGYSQYGALLRTGLKQDHAG